MTRKGQTAKHRRQQRKEKANKKEKKQQQVAQQPNESPKIEVTAFPPAQEYEGKPLSPARRAFQDV